MAVKFYLSAFADEAGNTIAEQIDALKAHKMTHIEPRGLDYGNISVYTAEQAKELKKILDDSGIGVSALGSPYGKIEITEDFAPHFEQFKRSVEVADILDTKRIRMFSFFFTQGQSYEEYKDEVFERLDKLCSYSLENGVMCCHENEKDIYGDIAVRCLEIFEAFPDKIRGVFDPANFIQCGEEIIPAYEMLKDYIDYFHIKDCLFDGGKVRPAGLGDANITELLTRAANDKDCDTFLTLEPHLKVFDGLKDLEGEGGTAEQLQDDFTYPTNRAAFDAAADASDDCLTKAKVNNITVRL